MARSKKTKPDNTQDWPHELRWYFGQVSRVDVIGAIQLIQGKDIGGDDLQRAFQPDILQNITEGARALFVVSLEQELHNIATDCDQILRKKNVAGYDAEPKLFSPDWYEAGEPIQREGGFLIPTGDNDEIAAPHRYCDALKPFTPEFYAGETLERCRKLLWFFKAPSNRSPSNFSDVEKLIMTALETGRLIAEAEWRQLFERAILKYRNSRDGGAPNLEENNDEKRNNKNDRLFEIEAILRKLGKPGLKGGALKRHILKNLSKGDHEVTPRTIGRYLKEIEERQKQR